MCEKDSDVLEKKTKKQTYLVSDQIQFTKIETVLHECSMNRFFFFLSLMIKILVIHLKATNNTDYCTTSSPILLICRLSQYSSEANFTTSLHKPLLRNCCLLTTFMLFVCLLLTWTPAVIILHLWLSAVLTLASCMKTVKPE